MKIDWKEVARSEGYKALKKQFIRDRQQAGKYPNRCRSKEEHLRLFRKIIDRAKSNAIRTNRTIIEVLDDWSIRGGQYWWYNSYTEQIRKVPSGKPSNIKHTTIPSYTKRELKRAHWLSKTEKRKRLRDAISKEAKWDRKEKGKTPRWDADKKAHARRLRE